MPPAPQATNGPQAWSPRRFPLPLVASEMPGFFEELRMPATPYSLPFKYSLRLLIVDKEYEIVLVRTVYCLQAIAISGLLLAQVDNQVGWWDFLPHHAENG